MPSVTIFLPWPTLSVAPLPPTLVLTPDLLRLILTPGRTLNVLRKRNPIVLRLSSILTLGEARDLPASQTGTQQPENARRARRHSAVQVEQVAEPPQLVLDLPHRSVARAQALV